MAFDQAKNSN